MQIPDEGREYPVVLGSTLFDSNLEDQAAALSSDDPELFAAFQYKFRPVSVKTTVPSLFSVDDTCGATLLRASTHGSDSGMTFKGKVSEQKDTECLLIFDGTSFRLERCAMVCSQLRHFRTPSITDGNYPKKNLAMMSAFRTAKDVKKALSRSTRKTTKKVAGGTDAASDGTVTTPKPRRGRKKTPPPIEPATDAMSSSAAKDGQPDIDGHREDA